MAKRRAKKKVRRAAEKVPLSTAVGLFATLLGNGVAEEARAGNFKAAFDQLAKNLTGYDLNTGTWSGEDMIKGLAPLIAGSAVSWGASKFGLNRRLKTLKLPVKI